MMHLMKKILCTIHTDKDDEINAKHLRNFKIVVEAVEHLDGAIFADNALIKYVKYEN